jgi:hypothetical protein
MAQFLAHSGDPAERVFLCGVLADKPKKVILWEIGKARDGSSLVPRPVGIDNPDAVVLDGAHVAQSPHLIQCVAKSPVRLVVAVGVRGEPRGTFVGMQHFHDRIGQVERGPAELLRIPPPNVTRCILDGFDILRDHLTIARDQVDKPNTSTRLFTTHGQDGQKQEYSSKERLVLHFDHLVSGSFIRMEVGRPPGYPCDPTLHSNHRRIDRMFRCIERPKAIPDRRPLGAPRRLPMGVQSLRSLDTAYRMGVGP